MILLDSDVMIDLLRQYPPAMQWFDALDEDEKGAINKYRLAMEKADSEKLKTVFERLMHEEQVHIDFLEEEIRRLKKAS